MLYQLLSRNSRTHLRKFFSILLIIGFLGLYVSPVEAQVAISTITIKSQQVDTKQFPVVAFRARVADSSGFPISGLQASSLNVTENNLPVQLLAATPVEVGLQVVFVIHPGVSPTEAPGYTLKPRFEEAKEAILQFATQIMQNDNDAVAIIEQRDAQAVSVRPLTSKVDQMKSAITTYVPVSSPQSIPAIDAALKELAQATDGANRHQAIIVLSSGWEVGLPDDLIKQATQQGVQVHVVQLRQGDVVGLTPPLQRLAREPNANDPSKRGVFINYTGSESLKSIYSDLARQRGQYQITFRSTIGGAAKRTITIKSSAVSNAVASIDYTPPTGLAQITFTSLQNGFVVRRHAKENVRDPASIPPPTQTVSVTVQKAFGDQKFTSAELFVNGTSMGVRSSAGPNYDWVWDLGNFVVAQPSSTPIEKPVELKVEVTDELGQKSLATITGVVSFLNPLSDNSECAYLRTIPGIGSTLLSACNAGFTPVAVIQTGILLAILILVILFRRPIAEGARKVTEVVKNRVTQIMGGEGGRRPKAFLIPLDGFPPDENIEGKKYEIYSETPIGADPEKAGLVFTRKILSGLHCTIHDRDKEPTRTWMISDNSSNGTWLNGTKLGLGKEELHHGDIIELASVARGGIKFRFEIADGSVSRVTKPARATMPDDTSDEPMLVSRKTNLARSKRSSSNAESLDDFDPNEQDQEG